jgi:hypothetical protein
MYGEVKSDVTVPPRGLCYIQVKKIERNRCVSVDKKITFGDKTLLKEHISISFVSSTINTSFIERSNLSMSQHSDRIIIISDLL